MDITAVKNIEKPVESNLSRHKCVGKPIKNISPVESKLSTCRKLTFYLSNLNFSPVESL